MNRNIQKQHLSEIKSFCSIIHYTIQKFGVSIYLFGKEIIEINTFILQGCFKFVKSDDMDYFK